jgi:hypothetical protein
VLSILVSLLAHVMTFYVIQEKFGRYEKIATRELDQQSTIADFLTHVCETLLTMNI